MNLMIIFRTLVKKKEKSKIEKYKSFIFYKKKKSTNGQSLTETFFLAFLFLRFDLEKKKRFLH